MFVSTIRYPTMPPKIPILPEWTYVTLVYYDVAFGTMELPRSSMTMMLAWTVASNPYCHYYGRLLDSGCATSLDSL